VEGAEVRKEKKGQLVAPAFFLRRNQKKGGEMGAGKGGMGATKTHRLYLKQV